MSLFNLFKTKNKTIIKKEVECHPQLEYVLNLFFEFADKHREKIVQILISPAPELYRERIAFDLSFLLDGKVEWYQSPETDELFSLFKQIDNDPFCTVQYILDTYRPSSCYEETCDILKLYIEGYMRKYPHRRFQMESYGASMKIWDY